MSEVKPGKITHFANAVYEMLERQSVSWPSDRCSAGGNPQPGLTDWQMTMLFMDADNPKTGYLGWLRDKYPMTGENNSGGFIRMGRLWLVRNGYVIDTGTVRKNKYANAAGERFQARTGTVWHRAPSPVDPPFDSPSDKKERCPHCGGTGVMT